MNKVKKSSIIIGIIGLLIVLVGVTYSFFNYTKTGLANNFRVGRIYFNSSQNGTINLTNVFPITSEELNGDIGNHGSVTININGDTTHDKGVEYLVTLDQVNNEVNGKKIPITFNTEATGVGTSNENYYDDRGGETSMYKLYETGDIEENKYLLAGYIAPGVTGINGNITVIAYVDAKKMVITDTYLNGGETDEEWVDGRIVFTTDEWSSLNGNNALSFKIKVEANEGIWVKEDITPTRCFTFSEHKKNSTYNIARTNKNIMDCVDYLTNKWGNEEVGNTVDVGETYDGFCSGTGTNWGRTISDLIEQNVLNNDELEEYNNIGIITINYTTSVVDYDISCGTDVIIPSKVNVEKTKKAEYVIACAATKLH